MKRYPDVPEASAAPQLFEGGHLWAFERVSGGSFAFSLTEAGVVQFGVGERVTTDPEALPLRYRPAVRHVREHLDREAIRAAVDDVTAPTFFAVATSRESVGYDWVATPPALGVEVYSGTDDDFRPPELIERIFEGVGLEPAPAVEKERPAKRFDPDGYAFPASAYRDGPAVGVLLRNKTGERAVLWNPDVESADEPEPYRDGPAEAARRLASDGRLSALARRLRAEDRPVTVEALLDRAVAVAVRDRHAELDHPQTDFSMREFRSATAARVRAFLDSTDGD